MQIDTGLFDHMVLQRAGGNASAALVTGVCERDGEVRATVKKSGRTLSGWRGRAVGSVRDGRLKAMLKGIPAGGPYEISLEVADRSGMPFDRATVRDVLVGDVWLLGGQSNMEGCGLLAGQPPSHQMVRAFYMDDKWRVARDPLHNLWSAVDQVHADLCGGARPAPKTVIGAGPGLSFGLAMRQRTGVPQGLIACAHGGTSMSQWDPALKDRGGRSLYGAMVRRLAKNGGRVAGLIWYQGESDACDAATASLYTQRMKAFVEALRKDAGDPLLPVALVQIGRVVVWGAAEPWLSIQDQQRRLPETIRNCTVVPAIDLPLDDGIHISGRGQVVLGRRLAEAMDAMLRGSRAGRPPIALRGVAVERDPARGTANVRVDFENVVGRLVSDGRPVGFSVLDRNRVEQCFDVELRGSSALMRTGMSPGSASLCSVIYGPNTNPCCNVRDEAGRPLPVFGPISVGRPAARTGYIRELRVSMFHPSAGDLTELKHPPRAGTAKWTPRAFAGDFCDLHLDIAAKAPQDLVVYYACGFECPEPMDLGILLGYDGPVKMWVDSRELFHDPDGRNPAIPDAKSVDFKASRGGHEIVIALGTNQGKAWGIFLALERRDVPVRLVQKGRDYYTLPRVTG